MNLKNLMEDKKLDFNQPLLSVRRVSSTAVSSQAENKGKTDNSFPKIPPLPFYKSELKSGPVRNPGTVPFIWEQTPGKPKDERKAQTLTRERSRIGPKLPPGRVPNVKQQDCDQGSKAMTITQYKPENFLPRSQNISSLDKNVNKYESSKEKMEVKEGSGSEDGDETYLDALDTISRTESFLMDCSISGLSSFDAKDGKPSGTFSMDPQTRDFMMGRFLPAAKAMASETPQHATWKQPILREQPRQVKKLVTRDKRGPLSQYRSNVVSHHAHDIGGIESEDEADDYDGSEISSSKVCGLFPRFCFKNSLCLLNPVPGMRMQTGVPISSVRTVRAKSLYSSSCSEPEKEHARGAVYEQRSLDGHATAELHEEKIEVKSISNQTTYKSDCGKSDESSLKRDLQGNGISACQSESCHSLHGEKSFLGFSEKAKNSRMNGSDLDRKGPNIFQELLANESTEWESRSMSPVVEKTLYIDSVHTVKSRNSNSSSSDMRGLTDYIEDDFRIPVKSSETEKSPSVDFSVQDLKHLSAVDEKAKVQHESSESVDACFLSCSDISSHDIQMEMVNDSKQDQDLTLNSSQLTSSKAVDTKKFDSEITQPLKSGDPEGTHGLTQDSSRLTSSKVAGNGKIGLETRRPKKSCTRESSGGLIQDSVTFASLKVGEKIDLENRRPKTLANQETSPGNYPHLPLGPPLPKSPSESWLKRTLPTISSRNLPSRSSLAIPINTRNPASKTTSLDSNWETIVKTSNVRHGHLRFSEELLTPIPEA